MGNFNNIEFAGLTDVGVRRPHNQDSYAILVAADAEQWQTQGHFFLVADGMGAHAVGELASKLAADSIPHIYSKHAQEGAVTALRRAFVESNTAIHTRGQRNREFEGMGTTSSALLLRPEGAWISHVGDSRVYRVRAGKIEQISFDHSLVWEMARRQKCSPEELRGIPPNVIVRSLGPEPLVQIDIEGPHPIYNGDIFVLCSDGLSGPIGDEEIGAVVSALPPEEACHLLIDLANMQGGPDNITALVIRVTDPALENNPNNSSPNSRKKGRKKKWQERYPWPLLSLFLGILLAMGAILLTVYQLWGGNLAFFLAAIAIISGLAGVMLQYKREEKSSHTPLQATPPNIYRETPCVVTEALLEKISRAQETLQERIREHGWSADWDTWHRHQDRAEELLQNKNLTEAFAESCRALRILTEAIQKQRTREESFQPLWEKRSAR